MIGCSFGVYLQWKECKHWKKEFNELHANSLREGNYICAELRVDTHTHTHRSVWSSSPTLHNFLQFCRLPELRSGAVGLEGSRC